MDLFVARQPIFDRRARVVGYELLYRSGVRDGFDADDHDRATAATIANSFFDIGIDRLVGRAKAFVNFTRDTLVADYALVLPRDTLVVEVLECVVVDAEVRAACERLKAAGYTLALDDFGPGAPTEALLDLADIVKVDFRQVDPAIRAALAVRRPSARTTMLAEKVETAEELAEARDLGYELFQGYALSRPETRHGRRSPGLLAHRLRLMQVLTRPDPDLAEVEMLMKHDPSLTFKLLRYVNSAAFGLRSPVRTLGRAIAYLGQDGARTWGMIALLADLGRGQPAELVVASVVRARFCELLGEAAGLRGRSSDLFLLGLFSLLDEITGLPLAQTVGQLPLADDVRAALLGEPSELGGILDLAAAYESGDWPSVLGGAADLGLAARGLPSLYLASVEWGNVTNILAA